MSAHTPAWPFPVHRRRPEDHIVDLTAAEIEHRALRGTLARLHNLLGDGEPTVNETTRARRLEFYVRRVVDATIRHHRIEDDYMWPLLMASTDNGLSLGQFSDDHVVLDELLEKTVSQAEAFANNPTESGRHAMMKTIGSLAAHINTHLDREEELIFPAIHNHVSEQDYQLFERQARQLYSARDITFLGPWLASYASEEERNRVLTPNVAYRVLHRLGNLRFAALDRAVFGEGYR